MQEPGRRDLLRAQTAADAVVAVKDEHFGAVLSQHAGGDQAIDAAANDDIVWIGHWFLPAGIVGRAWAGGSVRNEGQRAHRRSGALDELQRGCDQDRALRGQLVEMAKARQAVAVRLMHERMGRERRIHASRRAGVRADCLGAPTDHALGDQISDCFRGWAGRMGPFASAFKEGIRRRRCVCTSPSAEAPTRPARSRRALFPTP